MGYRLAAMASQIVHQTRHQETPLSPPRRGHRAIGTQEGVSNTADTRLGHPNLTLENPLPQDIILPFEAEPIMPVA